MMVGSNKHNRHRFSNCARYKWKLNDQTKPKGKDKFGMSQADFYQMLGYGHKYLEGFGNLVLIYPKHSSFDKPFEHRFNYDEQKKTAVGSIF